MMITCNSIKVLSVIILIQLYCHTLQAIDREAELGSCSDNNYCDIGDQGQPSVKFSHLKPSRFRVAALELYRKWGDNCRSTSELNLNIFERAAKLASENGAKMLVFPEDGIMYEPKEDLVNCIEEIPNPDKLSAIDNNPCINTNHYNRSMPILVRLSCIARENNLYLIANYGTRQSCEPGHRVDDEICPVNGYFMLNTNVVFDSSGNFIKRYRKYNIYSETEIFDKAPSLEHVYFDTPYGRFGVFTCFDLIFKQPAIDLVEMYSIDTVIFPTWWFDELPMLTAVQYQDGWSWKNNVNFISANILRPSLGSVGSAIISGKNILNTGRSSNNGTRTRLLIANIATHSDNDGDNSHCDNIGDNSYCDNHENFNPKLIDLDEMSIQDLYAHKNTKTEFDSYWFLNEGESRVSMCRGGDLNNGDYDMVCCTLEYKYERINRNSHLLLHIRNRRRDGFYGWYEQFCVIATVIGKSPSIKNLMAHNYIYNPIYTDEPSFKFEKLSIRMNTTTKYVYPIGAQNAGKLISRRDRSFECDYDKGVQECEHSLNIVDKKNKLEVISFGIFGRLYEGDVEPKEKIRPRAHYVPGSEEH